MLNRRSALIALLTLPLGSFNALKAQTLEDGKARLVVPLDQWSDVVVQLGGKEVVISAQEIFAVLSSKE